MTDSEALVYKTAIHLIMFKFITDMAQTIHLTSGWAALHCFNENDCQYKKRLNPYYKTLWPEHTRRGGHIYHSNNSNCVVQLSPSIFSLSLSKRLEHFWHLIEVKVRGQRTLQQSGEKKPHRLSYETAANNEPATSMTSHYKVTTCIKHERVCADIVKENTSRRLLIL